MRLLTGRWQHSHARAHTDSPRVAAPQLFTSCLFLAGAVAALVGSYTCRRFGRKATMMAGGACFLVGTALVACAVHMVMLVLGRLVLGVGVGFATQATPLYLSEMAPYKLRGALNIL